MERIKGERGPLYRCSECGFHYHEETLAKRCETWCREHKSCNVEITKNAIENEK